MRYELKHWLRKIRAEKLIPILKAKGYEVIFCDNKEEALKKILEMIPDGSTVGMGGSLTVQEIGLYDALKNGNYTFFDPYDKNLSKEEKFEMRKKGLTADYFITGINAITMDGKLVYLDAYGNRVAAIMFGPKKVILVAGVNKIAGSVEDAISRIRNYAAILNAKRLNKNTPCVTLGKCTDCDSTDRICNYLLIIERQPFKGRITIVLINESLGL